MEARESVVADDVIVYITDYNDSSRELLQQINTFTNIARYKINSQNLEMLL